MQLLILYVFCFCPYLEAVSSVYNLMTHSFVVMIEPSYYDTSVLSVFHFMHTHVKYLKKCTLFNLVIELLNFLFVIQ